jgi:hypothetical protein
MPLSVANEECERVSRHSRYERRALANMTSQLRSRALFQYINTGTVDIEEPRYLSRYRDCLRVGLPRGRNSSPGNIKNFHLSI